MSEQRVSQNKRSRQKKQDAIVHVRSNKREKNNLSSYQTVPITSHYALNNQILDAFESLYEQRVYNVAYAVGLQFVETALLDIPKHGYFYSNRHEEERNRNSMEALRVTEMLNDIFDSSLEQDTLQAEKRQSELSTLSKLAQGQVRNDELDRYEAERSRAEAELSHLRQAKKDGSGYFEDLWDMGDYCGRLFGRTDEYLYGNDSYRKPKREHQNLSIQPPDGRHGSGSFSSIDANYSRRIRQQESRTGPSESPVPFPFQQYPTAGNEISQVEMQSTMTTKLPPDRTGHYDDGLSSSRLSLVEQDEIDLQRALYLSGLEVTPVSEERPNRQVQPKVSQDRVDIVLLSSLYHEDFDQLRQEKRIRAYFLDTYQGKHEGSTNGCTVIAPLLCIRHFHNRNDVQDELLNINNEYKQRTPRRRSVSRKLIDNGISDMTIAEVIDVEAPAILPQVRKKLGLTKNALIIPSDVHDYLMDEDLLTPSQFVTVCGGNILDENHFGSFIATLVKTESKERKIATTLFFHEHVICVLKLHRGGSAYWYDIIDSLPSSCTLEPLNNDARNNHGTSSFHSQGFFSSTASNADGSGRTVEFPFGFPEDGATNAVRIRCLDEESLRVTLKWYSCSKFTPDNQKFINTYTWDERKSDFDPRVFQAFIWCEA